MCSVLCLMKIHNECTHIIPYKRDVHFIAKQTKYSKSNNILPSSLMKNEYEVGNEFFGGIFIAHE